jgi:hypothetical protein
MKAQPGTLTKTQALVAYYFRWLVDSATCEKTRQQKAHVVGSVADVTKTEAQRKLIYALNKS